MNVLTMTKKAAIAEFKAKLSSDEKWALKGMLTINEYQTMQEKVVGATVEDNGVGFSGTDSVILMSFSQQVNAGRSLSPRQMAVVFKCMPKYDGQLHKIAVAKAKAKEDKEMQAGMDACNAERDAREHAAELAAENAWKHKAEWSHEGFMEEQRDHQREFFVN